MVDNEPAPKRPCHGRASPVIEANPASQTAETAATAKSKVTVIGGGSFGLAMASVVGKKGHPTCILVRKDDVSNSMPPKKVSGEEGRKGPCCGKLGGMVHGDGIPKHM
ncbi:glycerol-3-phosphate dehydrogenase, partial [Nannochloropsis gaditana CCMP526]|uniref:glycerol-3-phosphate dehydrogenase n=1 Tax=Nannochloropsis gaditana (strain CCMP526) TaxID=1093141 RepID=UPI00029F6598